MSDSTIKPEAILLSKDDGNFFFGFHDLVAWNFQGDKILALRNDNIHSPPDGNTPIDVGFIADDKFVKLGITYAFNYPQGARQQWIGKTNSFIINDKNGDRWGSKIYDTDTLRLVKTLNYPAHVLTGDGWAFGLDYSRLHRVGGYGYTGLPDNTANAGAPENTGITKHNIYTGENALMLSVKQVANFEMAENTGKHHYLTHLLLNPQQNRLAFLHRFKLKDGGETTRLMTIGVNGEDLRCLLTGFLSHFNWKDDKSVLIWGRTGSDIEKLRTSFVYKMLPPFFLFYAKKVAKLLLNRNKDNGTSAQSAEWMLITDKEKPEMALFAKGVMTEDGHPMFCPANRDWLVCDTYPNDSGIRQLYLYQHSVNTRHKLGQYKMINDKPEIESCANSLKDVDADVLKSFSIEKMAFYRSGLHCDLHPRWKDDGSMVCFDSIHEGIRKIYGIKVNVITDTLIA